jgi:hypothetical protein
MDAKLFSGRYYVSGSTRTPTGSPVATDVSMGGQDKDEQGNPEVPVQERVPVDPALQAGAGAPLRLGKPL